jgi:glucose dehydrogenase
VIFDAVVDGKPRKLLAQAARNGYFVVLDRETGKNLVTTPFVPLNWSKGVSERGEPIPDPRKEPSVAGSLTIGSATNWFPPSYSSKSGLFYVNGDETWELYYLTDLDPKPAGYAGTTTSVGEGKKFLDAIDVKGHVVWRHDYPSVPGGGGGGNGGVLSTAGGLVIGGDGQRNLIVFRDTDGTILWHAAMKQNISNGAITVMIDGKQWMFVGAGDSMYAYGLK